MWKKCCHLLFSISSAFLAMFRSNAIYDPCVWHTYGTLKTCEKQEVSGGLSPVPGSHASACLMSWSLAQVPSFPGSIQPFGAFDKSRILRKHIASSGVAGNLVWSNLQKPNKCQTCSLRTLFAKFSCVTKVYKIYLQITQIQELFKLFVPWQRLNQLCLYWTAFISKSNISRGHFLWNLIDVMPRRKFAL